jgi:hypothetical protein
MLDKARYFQLIQEFGDIGSRVEKGETVRIRIVGTRVDATQIVFDVDLVCYRYIKRRLFGTFTISGII